MTMETEKKTEIKIAYEILNLTDGKYTISATLMDTNNKVFEQCTMDLSIEEFNSTITYTDEQRELLLKANEIAKSKTAANIAHLLEDKIMSVVEKIKSTLN